MNKEILLVVEAVSNEKGVAKEIIFQAVEAALAAATKKRHEDDIHVRVSIDRTTGDYETFRYWDIVPDEELEISDQQIALSEAIKKQANIAVGDTIEEPLPSINFGRIAAQMAKQVIVQKVREAERAKVVESYRDRLGELVSGTVKKVTRDQVVIDLGGNAEGVFYRDEMLPREAVHTSDRIRGYLYEVKAESKGAQLLLSRTRPEMLSKLFEIEVPEIGEAAH